MKKIIALTLLAAGLTAQSHALTNTGTVWAGAGCQSAESNQPGLRYCTTTLSSATTTTQIGRVMVSNNKVVAITLGVSGSAVANVVTPTISYYLGNKVIATQDVSVSTAGNVVLARQGNSLGQPLFTAIAVSVSVPSTISQTNGVVVGITENDK